MSHKFALRVYYEDTDLAGIVYYANYLKFIERGRSEWIRSLGLDQKALKEEEGIVFAVRRLEADYLAPAKFDDELTVVTSLEGVSGVRVTLRQEVRRDGKPLFSAHVVLVALTEAGAPARLPGRLRQQLH